MTVPMHLPPQTAKVIDVVWVPTARGDGSQENPERWVDLYFSREGGLLASHDPLNGPPDAFHARRPMAGAPTDMARYCTDAYDREGCVASVRVARGAFVLSISAPNGAPMEHYAPVSSPTDISRMLLAWCEGKVPQLRDVGNQPSAMGSRATS